MLECHQLQVTDYLPFFFSSTMSEFVSITRSSNLLLKDFLRTTKDLLDRMINQGGSKRILLKLIKKAFNRKLKDIHNIKLWIQIL